MPIIQEHQDDMFYFHHMLDPHPCVTQFGMHVHEEYEILYFLSGQARFIVEATAYKLGPGSLVMIRPMEYHRLEITGDVPYERFNIHFWPSILGPVDPEGRLLSLYNQRALGQGNLFGPEDFGALSPGLLFETIGRSGRENLRRNVLLYLYPLFGQLGEACRRRSEQARPGGPGRPADPIVDYINRHLFDELSLQSISERFYISRSQLNRLFRQATGSSVWDYILLKRLVAARNAIRQGRSTSEAAMACGWKDYSSFYRSYKARFGVSPAADHIRKLER